MRRGIAAAVVVGSVSLALAGCDNALMTYLFKGILYQGWKVASWSTPAPVVATETHEPPYNASNGFPMNMAMGSNGALHLVGWKVNDFEWVSTSMAPGAEEFVQAFTHVNSTLGPDEYQYARSPAIDLVVDDTPIIAYGVGYTGATHYLMYQEFNAGAGAWGPAQTIQSNSSSVKYAPVFLAFFSDIKSHIWYLASETIWHTVTSPVSPSVWLTDVGRFAAVRSSPRDAAFVYTDTAKTSIYYRTWEGSSSTPLWTAPSGIEISEMSITQDSGGASYVSFGTFLAAEPTNSAHFVLHFFTNTGGAWRELESITGPMYTCASALDVAADRWGNEHLHIVYTLWTPPLNFSIWYSYYDESGWSPPQNLDTLHSAFYPQVAVDPAGTVHVVYSWYSTELDRTLMYVRGTPGEPQNQ